MEAKTKTETYDYFESIFDGTHEVPIDTSYDLPDYCADIQKILKCEVKTEISSYSVFEEALSCEGVCDIRVMYLDAKGSAVKCCDFTKEFSANVKMKTDGENTIAMVEPSVDFMTCRAVSARRLDLHMSVALKIYAVVQKRNTVISEIEEGGVEVRPKTVEISRAVNAFCHQFTVEEYLPLKNGKPPIENILRKEIKLKSPDFRLSDDRLELSSSADISFLYSSFSEESQTEKFTTGIEISQSVDCPGAMSGNAADIRLICGESRITPKEDSVGEYMGVQVVIKVFAFCLLYDKQSLDIIDDAYSVERQCSTSFSQKNLSLLTDSFSETVKKKMTVRIEESEVQRILDIWCEMQEAQPVIEQNGLGYRLKYNVCMLYVTAAGGIQYTEKSYDFTASSERREEERRKYSCAFDTRIWEYRITDRNTVEISAETLVNAAVYENRVEKCLSIISLEEDARPVDGKLLVYYAGKGEKIWGIGKKFRAPISEIQTQNELFEDEVPEKMPVIIRQRN